MTVYVPNSGEVEALKAILNAQAIKLMLYSNVITPDNTLALANLTELASGGSYGYAEQSLNAAVNEAAPASGSWYVGLNSAGAAQAQYGLSSAPVTWTFNSYDVAEGVTVYGIAAYTWVLPFSTGLAAGGTNALLGVTIYGAGGATGVITGIVIDSGSWAGGNAAGYFNIMTKTGTFLTGEGLFITSSSGTRIATNASGGDAVKKLLYVENFSAGTAITA